MQSISIDGFKEVIKTEASNPSVDFINVCTPPEYKEKHIPGVRNVPLDVLAKHLNDFTDKKTIYIHCRSGRRGEQAIKTLSDLGVKAELVNVTGGLLAWDQAGLPTNSLTKRLPLIRQVLLAAGSLVVLSYLVSVVVYPPAIYLAVAIGLGLSFAGLTGWCGMSYALAKMPWNR